MGRIAHAVIRARWPVVAAWLVLTFFGAIAAGKLTDRWFQEFSIPGYSAYEANSRIFDTFGIARNYPLQLVFQVEQGDIREQAGIERAIGAAAALTPGASTSSWFSTGGDAFVSEDRRTMFAEVYPPGQPEGFVAQVPFEKMREAVAAKAPAGVTTHLTGVDPIFDSQGEASGPSVLVETMIGAVGALVILLFVFGTLPAVLVPMLSAAASILTTFLLVYGLTYLTDVSLVVQFLVALVGLGLAIDYSLLMIFRFREELRHGREVDDAIVETMQHAGRSVIVSGSTVAIGLLSMLILPLPFIRSIGIGGMLIPAVSVLASITLTVAMLRILGHRINRIRVMPKRLSSDDAERGFWTRWAAIVARRPLLVFAIGVVIVVALLIPASQLNPADAQTKDQPAAGDAEAGRQALSDAGITDGVYRPFLVLVEGSSAPGTLEAVAGDLAGTPGVEGAQAPPGDGWRRGDAAVLEAFSATDGASKQSRGVIKDIQRSVLPKAEGAVGTGVTLTLGGPAAEERDFVHAVYGNFPYVLLFVVLLTFILLARAFRSIVLPLKAVILNLVSLGCAFGVVVFVFQEGHGSEALWGVHATGVVISWIPLMIFAFLFGISMDYEVFMITRIRESYDETHDTKQAISLGLARTGKLVTSAALVLMFAFFALSTGPGLDIKQFGIGLAAGVIIDATLIRLLLVPSTMQLLGRWNWWLPAWCARALRTRPSPLEPRPSAETQPSET